MSSFRKVTFLDTHSLHFIHLHLCQATEHSLFPFASEEETAYQHLGRMEKGKLRKSLTQGLDALANLRTCCVETRVWNIPRLPSSSCRRDEPREKLGGRPRPRGSRTACGHASMRRKSTIGCSQRA